MNIKSCVFRIVMAILVGALLGYSIAVGPNLYKQWRSNSALLEAMATDPAYQVLYKIEAGNPNLFVANVGTNESKGYSVAFVWILHIGRFEGETEEENIAYLVELLRLTMQSLVDGYPTKHSYMVVFGGIGKVATIEGVKDRIVARMSYQMSADAIRSFLGNPTKDTLDRLERVGTFMPKYVAYYNIALTKILPREPGYIWPWSDEWVDQ